MKVKPYIILNTSKKHVNYEEDKNKVPMNKPYNIQNNAIHFFLECPLYQHNRTSLFNYFNNIVPISIEYIVFGCKEISEEFNTLFII
jgi:CRISPR/Cas system-associated protein Cas10 (large subunit of type III CRISPR-Cas system)